MLHKQIMNLTLAQSKKNSAIFKLMVIITSSSGNSLSGNKENTKNLFKLSAENMAKLTCELR